MTFNTPTAITALLALAIAATAADASASEAKREQAVENFLEADANADGALTRNEFATLISLNADDGIGRARMVKRLGKQDVAFGRLDANADGLVTTDEMKAAAEANR
ncbi:MAG: hypothetical protein AAFU72_12605 [Pseudomonadota bacterium]